MANAKANKTKAVRRNSKKSERALEKKSARHSHRAKAPRIKSKKCANAQMPQFEKPDDMDAYVNDPELLGFVENKDVKGLISALVSMDREKRRLACCGMYALAGKGVLDKTALPPLIRCLSDIYVHVRRNAAYALYGLAAKNICDLGALPSLNRCLADEDPYVRENASHAIIWFALAGVGSVSSIEPLNRCISSDHLRARSNAIEALGVLATSLGIGSSTSLPLLNECLSDMSSPNEEDTIMALAARTLRDLCRSVKIADRSSIIPLANCLDKKPAKDDAFFALSDLSMRGLHDHSIVDKLIEYKKTITDDTHKKLVDKLIETMLL